MRLSWIMVVAASACCGIAWAQPSGEEASDTSPNAVQSRSEQDGSEQDGSEHNPSAREFPENNRDENSAPEAQTSSDSELSGNSLGTSPSIDANRAEASLRTQTGQLAFQRGELEQARRDFEAAYALAPTAENLWNVTRALEALRDDSALQRAYDSYLELGVETVHHAEVAARLVILRALQDTAPNATPPPSDGPSDQTTTNENRSLTDEPWFWATVAVLGASGLAAVLVVTSDQGAEPPLRGDDGVIVRTLVELP